MEPECIYNTQLESVKISLAIRAARGVVGISQGDLSTETGVPRVTLARLETLRGNLRADQFLTLLHFFKKRGVFIDLTDDLGFHIRVDQAFIEHEARQESLLDPVISEPPPTSKSRQEDRAGRENELPDEAEK